VNYKFLDKGTGGIGAREPEDSQEEDLNWWGRFAKGTDGSEKGECGSYETNVLTNEFDPLHSKDRGRGGKFEYSYLGGENAWPQ